MLGPVHRTIEPELIFEFAIHQDDVFAIHDSEGAGERFVHDRKICPHGDGGAFAFPPRLDCEHLRVSFAMPRQSGGFFFGRDRPESIDTDKDASAAVKMRRSGLAPAPCAWDSTKG